MKYPKLDTPFKIGNVEIRNRFVMLPMTIEKTENYAIGEDLINFYEQRAKGGAGLIEIGSCYVCDCFDTHPKYHTTTGAVGVWDDMFIPGLKKTSEACHKHGAKLAAQLQLCYEWRLDGSQPLLSYAPSKDVMSGPFVGMPEREFTVEEIHQVVEQYGQAARRCKEGGIDIIEIHAGIGYMVMRFISKYSNHRTDEYGGDTKGRCKLLTDIIDEIHKTCGEDMPILVRYSADDLMPGGQRVEDLKEVIEVVEAHGIDAWSIQAGFHEAPRPVANQLVPEGEFIYLSKEAKKYTKLPCFPGTRINHLDVCEKILTDGSGDAAGMARHWIAEPEMGIKVHEDRIDEVKPCIVCSRCLDNIFIGKPCKCSVNPNVYFSQFGLPEEHPTDDPNKKILIIGAGAAGCEAARNLKLRGYNNITVVDQKKKVGGLLNLAQVLNDEIIPLTAWYQNEMKRLNIDVRLNTKADYNFIKAFNADEVIVATGPETSSPDVPGKNNKNVIDSHALKELVEGHNTPGMGFMWGLSCLGMGILCL
ncbi:MAG: NADH:flavin oxidoreductase [Coriobacteriia bacterium]|nr:NADH:flavin oxidoreductase [Coriobacteriia bacterium]